MGGPRWSGGRDRRGCRVGRFRFGWRVGRRGWSGVAPWCCVPGIFAGTRRSGGGRGKSGGGAEWGWGLRRGGRGRRRGGGGGGGGRRWRLRREYRGRIILRCC